MQREDLKDLSRERLEQLICEWVVRYHNLEEEFNAYKKRRETLYDDILKFEEENSRLKETIKSQRDKIDSLLKELEEKGKTITISDGAITMRADMWEALNENKELKDENKSLKQQNDYLKNIFETAYIPESAESIMRKYGFSEEFIQDAIRMNEAIGKNVRKEIFKNENDVDKDKLISELQDQHQQDCIKINQLHVTIDTLVDKYSRLRKTVGMD